jgi:oxygen-independent coproporphyrinogen-3 oxidase
MSSLMSGPTLAGDAAAGLPTTTALARRQARQPLSIYVHLPFCVQKCGYCDFNAYLYREDAAQAYLQALHQEIMHAATRQRWWMYDVPSIYFGGGTPSTMAATHLTGLLDLIQASFPIQTGAEVTVEVDPGTIDLAGLEALRVGGFNRLSIGVQAFADALLRGLDRRHSATDARGVLRWARQAGFVDLNMDLMFGLPGQTLSAWEESLGEAIACAPTHLSVYGLTIEARTPFARRLQRGQLVLPDDEMQTTMFERADQLLSAAGYRHYEISNYALPGWRSQHNLHYWHHGEYLGFGAGAHAYLQGQRWENERLPRRYADAIARRGSAAGPPERIDGERRRHEGLMVGLRLQEGIDLAAFARLYGVSLTTTYAEPIAELTQAGYVHIADGRLCLTERGRLVADAVLGHLLAAEPS